jgi:hypothetical protein
MTESANSTNFTIGTDESNTHLDEDGNLHSMADRHDGDDTDDLDWDVDRDGRMREYATDDEPTTIPWED